MAVAVLISVLLTVYIWKNVSVGQVFSDPQSPSDIAHQRLVDALTLYQAPYGYRAGDATKTHSCGQVREVPSSLRFSWVMRPRAIPEFYQKYTEAYNIPVLGSVNVSDSALKRACYVLRFMLADSYALRQSYYKLFGRVVVIGAGEKVTTVPEYKFLPDYWNARSRGLGATETVPVTSGAEENLLCYGPSKDRYDDEDIFLHELTHGLHLLGAKPSISGFQDSLSRSYNNAIHHGLWKDTYSSQSAEEYLAEAAQSYFVVNGHSDTPDGVHGPVSSPEKLRGYDPSLLDLVQYLFPCGNIYLKRCNSTRDTEAAQVLKMDCDLTREYQIKMSELAARYGPSTENVFTTTTTTEAPTCTDLNISCKAWAADGECTKNSAYMKIYCRRNCGVC